MTLDEAIKRVREEGGTAKHGEDYDSISMENGRVLFYSGDKRWYLASLDDWTYEPPPPKLVSAAEAFEALHEGKCIAKITWTIGERVRVHCGYIIYDRGIGVHNYPRWNPSTVDLTACDWLILP